MATNITGVSITRPLSDPAIDSGQSFVMGGQITTAGGGGWGESGDMYFEWDQGSGSWATIGTSGDLYHSATNPKTGLQTTAEQTLTVYAGAAVDGTFQVRVKLIEDDSTTYTTAATTVTVTNAAADRDISGLFDAVDAEDVPTVKNENLGGVDAYSEVSLEDTPTVEVEDPLPLSIDVFDSAGTDEYTDSSNENLGGIDVYSEASLEDGPTAEVESPAPIDIDVYDSTGVEEQVDGYIELEINAYDEVDVAEDSLVGMEELGGIQVNDSTTVGEDIDVGVEEATPEADVDISVYDEIGVTDYPLPSIEQLGSIEVNDAISVSEDVTAECEAAIPESLGVDVYDGVTAGEDVSLSLSSVPSVIEEYDFDDWKDGEPITEPASDGSLDEWKDGEPLIIDEVESSGTNLSVYDSIGVSEDVTVSISEPLNLYIDLSDSVSVTEDITAEIEAAAGEIEVSVYDEADVSESVDSVGGDVNASVSDAVGVGEDVSLLKYDENLYIDVYSSVGLTDSPIVSPFVETLSISVVDSTSLSEYYAFRRSQAIYIFSDSLGSVGSGDRNYRFVLPYDLLDQPDFEVDQVRIEYKSVTDGTEFTGSSIGNRDVDNEYIADEFARFTINGANGVTLGSNTYAWSDWIDIDFYNVTTDLAVHIYSDNFSKNVGTDTDIGSGYEYYYKLNLFEDQSMVEEPVAYGQGNDSRGPFRTIEVAGNSSYSFGGPYLINVSDSVGVSENVSVGLSDLAISVNDEVDVAEYTAVESVITTDITVQDEITVNEYSDVSLGDIAVNVNDSVVIEGEVTIEESDLPSFVYDSVSIAENIDRYIEVNLSVYDTVVTVEYSNISLDDLTVSVSDSVSVEDVGTIGTGATLGILVVDNVSVEEAVTAIYELPLGVSVYDSLTIGEQNDAETGSLSVSVYTNITVVGAATVFQPIYTLSVYDGVSANESIEASAGTLSISVEDSLSVDDSPTAELGESGPIDIPVIVDGVSVGEYAYLVAGDLNITVDDQVIVGEYAKPEWIIATGYLRQELILYTPDGDCILTCPTADIELIVPDVITEITLISPNDEMVLLSPDMEVEVL